MTDLARKVVDDLAHLLRAAEVMQRLRAVDHHQRRPRLEALAGDLIRQRGEAVALLGDRQVDDLERAAERMLVVERKRVEKADQLRVRLGERRVVERLPVLRRIRKADLVGEDRLARPGRAADHEQRPRRDAAP
jgi:ABC-type thiamine transport system ATPase subunit